MCSPNSKSTIIRKWCGAQNVIENSLNFLHRCLLLFLPFLCLFAPLWTLPASLTRWRLGWVWELTGPCGGGGCWAPLLLLLSSLLCVFSLSAELFMFVSVAGLPPSSPADDRNKWKMVILSACAAGVIAYLRCDQLQELSTHATSAFDRGIVRGLTSTYFFPVDPLCLQQPKQKWQKTWRTIDPLPWIFCFVCLLCCSCFCWKQQRCHFLSRTQKSNLWTWILAIPRDDFPVLKIATKWKPSGQTLERRF